MLGLVQTGKTACPTHFHVVCLFSTQLLREAEVMMRTHPEVAFSCTSLAFVKEAKALRSALLLEDTCWWMILSRRDSALLPALAVRCVMGTMAAVDRLFELDGRCGLRLLAFCVGFAAACPLRSVY